MKTAPFIPPTPQTDVEYVVTFLWYAKLFGSFADRLRRSQRNLRIMAVVDLVAAAASVVAVALTSNWWVLPSTIGLTVLAVFFFREAKQMDDSIRRNLASREESMYDARRVNSYSRVPNLSNKEAGYLQW